jgi:hypothetical protein
MYETEYIYQIKDVGVNRNVRRLNDTPNYLLIFCYFK